MNQFRSSGFNSITPVVKNLLIINVLFLLATYSLGSAFGIDLEDLLGLHFPFSEKFRPYQFITYMFMHADGMHLLSNMFGLWMFGTMLEQTWGSKKFLFYYLLTGIGAVLLHYLVVYIEIRPVLETINQTIEMARSKSGETAAGKIMIYKEALLSAPVVVGASGSIFGILLAYGLLFPETIIYLNLFIPMKAKYMVIFYGVLELYSGYSKQVDGIAHFAHLGGMLFGYALLKYWSMKKK